MRWEQRHLAGVNSTIQPTNDTLKVVISFEKLSTLKQKIAE